MKNKTKKRLLRALIAVFAAIFLFSGGMLVKEWIIEPRQSDAVVDQYRERYSPTSDVVPPAGESVLPEFQPLQQENDRIVGWLTVPGTNLDHPVAAASADDPNYYLTHAINGETSKYGSLFLSTDSVLDPQSQVLVVHGHNMEYAEHMMFGQLNAFKSLDFLKEHPTFTFDTIKHKGTWKIIAVCHANAENMAEFPYTVTNYASDADWKAFLRQVRERSLYRIRDDAAPGDPLLVLSTCNYLFYGDRLVIVARRLRAGESAEVDTSAYEDNRVTRWPERYYSLSYAAPRPSESDIAEDYARYYGAD